MHEFACRFLRYNSMIGVFDDKYLKKDLDVTSHDAENLLCHSSYPSLVSPSTSFHNLSHLSQLSIMKLTTIFSVRNVLRASGCLSVLLGAPMVIIPATAVSLYLGKNRDEDPDSDKKALSIVTRGFGIVGTASGIKSLVAEPTRLNLAVCLYQELLFVVYHLCNKFTGVWKEAGGDPNKSTAMISGGVVAVAVQGCALICSKCDDDDDDPLKTILTK